MSILNQLHIVQSKSIAWISFVGLALFFFVAPTTFAQEDVELDGTITLNMDEILGVTDDEEDEALSRLVDKSTISDLEFLATGDAPTSIDQLKAMQEHVASLYQRVEPAVVSIQSGMGQGSGVVVTSDGYILTAAHVIAVPNRSAVITFADGRKARAQTLGLFRTLDAGLLKIYAMMPERKKKKAAEEEASSQESSSKESPEEESPEEDADADADAEGGKGDSEDKSEEMKSEDTGEEADAEDSSGDEGADEASPGEDDDPGEDGDRTEPEEKMEADDESESESESAADEDEEGGEEGDDQQVEKENAAKPKKRDRFAVQDDLPSFNYLDIGDSRELKLGQWVIAVGHPGGLDEDRGIVLRVGRVNKIDTESEAANLKTDCTLVGGDSGGPLIGMDGSVIGIHSRIGIGLRDNFHVPSNDFVNQWTELLDPVVHDREAMTFITFRGRTNVIDEIPRRSMTARSGLKASDRIIRIGDKDIYDKLQFDDAISALKPYEEVEFEVRRKGKKKVINVTIGEKPERERR